MHYQRSQHASTYIHEYIKWLGNINLKTFRVTSSVDGDHFAQILLPRYDTSSSLLVHIGWHASMVGTWDATGSISLLIFVSLPCQFSWFEILSRFHT